MVRQGRFGTFLSIALIACFTASIAVGQQKGTIIRSFSGKIPPGVKLPPGYKPGQPIPGRASRPTKRPSSSKKSKTKKPGGKPGSPKTITRAATPKYKPDPKQLLIKPGKDGRIKFSFRGHKWDDVIDWYGIITNQATDWLELPGDYVNMSAARPMTLDETRGMLNQQLLARGFTILKQEGFLMVTNIKKLNPAMVPRVSVTDLNRPELAKYDFVRLSIPLDTLVAADVVKELDKIKSPNGKLIALTSTNRIEAMDAVINLREIYRIITEEQSPENQSRRAKEFQLKFVRAKDMKAKVEQFIGKSSGATTRTSRRSPQVIRGMMVRSSSRSKRPVPRVAAPKEVISIVADERRNTLICYAPPHKMALISRFIKMSDQSVSNDSLEKNLLRMKTYRLSGVDPKTVVDTLMELGGLDPMTRLRVDEKNQAIVAYASLYDQMLIQKTVNKLDGSGRRFEVISLRRNAADQLAGTIEQMMGGEKEKKSSRRDYGWYDYGYYGGRSRGNKDAKKDKFRVSADVEHNLLLLWCNEIELGEVEILLGKLGERTTKGKSRSTTRVLEVGRGSERIQFLKQLQKMWNAQGGQLIIPSDSELKDSEREFLNIEKTQEDARKKQKPAIEITPPKKAEKTTSRPVKQAIFTAFPGKGDKSDTPGKTTAKKDAAKKDAAKDTKSAKADTKQKADSKGKKAAAKTSQSPQATQKTPQQSAEFQRIFGNRGKASPAENTKNTKQPTITRRRRGLPPVVVSIGPNGEIILNSNDPDTLDRLERIFERMAPKRKDYKVFYLKDAPASWVSLNLEEFFQDKDEEADKQMRRWRSWDYGGGGSSDKKSQLSKRKKLKFVWDNDTNTILVQNADPDQLKTISDLIKLYDVPEPKSSQKTRITKLFPIKYSKATLIAATIKDAYRDLLSANDKALQTKGGNSSKKESSSRSRTYITNFGGGSGGKKSSGSRISFKGKLSIGINELTNSLVVSVEGDNLLKVVGGMIEQLDNAARTINSVSVMPLNGGVNSQQLHATLANILGLDPPKINGRSSRSNNNRRNNFNRNGRGNSNRNNSFNNNNNRRNGGGSGQSSPRSSTSAVPSRR